MLALKPLIFCVVAALLHTKLTPSVVKTTVPFGAVQLVLTVGVAVAEGNIGALVTVALVVLVQPFAPVTVTV